MSESPKKATSSDPKVKLLERASAEHSLRALNPAYHHDRDMQVVARAIGRFIHRKGFWPTFSQLYEPRKERWVEGALRVLVADMLQAGWIDSFSNPPVYRLTELGWERTPYKPTEPHLPAHPESRRRYKKYLKLIERVEKEGPCTNAVGE